MSYVENLDTDRRRAQKIEMSFPRHQGPEVEALIFGAGLELTAAVRILEMLMLIP